MFGRLLYAIAFTVALPSALAIWAWRLDGVVTPPEVHQVATGWALIAAGISLMLWSFWLLWRVGHGLPMNAYPPKMFVRRGPYSILSHPIYAGFCTAVAGCAIAAGSPAGLWIVTPFSVLACTALVTGYERDAVRALYGGAVTPPRLRFPEDSDGRPTAWHRAAALLLVLLPWLVVYEAVGHLPVPGAIDARFPGERHWPVLPWTEPFYASTYALVLLAPLAAATRRDLRWFCHAGLVATGVGTLCYLIIPVTSPPRPLDSTGVLGWMLRFERADGLEGRAAFPSFHVFWTLTAARVFARRLRTSGPAAPAVRLWGAAVVGSCVTTGMHAVIDVAGGMLLTAIAWNYRPIIARAATIAQRVANSWREWRFGPVRIINHAAYAGLAAGAGTLICAVLLSPRETAWVSLVAPLSLLGAGLWGKAFVGPPNSSRPFGYYGAVLGAGAGLIACARAGVLDWRAPAALAVASPWIQSIGRLRCLVQGCCHGAPAQPHAWWAIVYRHPRSRVCRVSGLAGVPLHPTPAYSIAGNIVIGLLLARLWGIQAPPTFIVGMYFVGAGLLRFVEEHFRGEPHTPIVGGLRIYQWFAAASIFGGMVISGLSPGPLSGVTGGVGWHWSGLGLSAAVGSLYFLAMGVDFPDSQRRFSRLT